MAKTGKNKVNVSGEVNISDAVNVSELRQRLPAYLAAVRKGGEISVTSRGKVIARIVAGGEPATEARDRLLAARKGCSGGDVVSPAADAWEAER